MSETNIGFDGYRLPFINNLLLRIKVRENPNYFTPHIKRLSEYLNLDRSKTTKRPNQYIPLGQTDGMRYYGFEPGEVSDRTIGSYQFCLFPDDFVWEPVDKPDHWTAEFMLREADRKPNPGSIFGGFDEAYRAGKTVLDIGSGQALADLQLVQKFSDTSFIGLDILYNQERAVFPGMRGLQLTKGDWKFLRAIPDKSIDTVTSLAGIGFWGLSETHDNDNILIAQALARVTKPGAVLRISATGKGLQFLQEYMGTLSWDIADDYKNIFIAKKPGS